jgi:hypothetical protein
VITQERHPYLKTRADVDFQFFVENGVGVIRVSAEQARPASVTARDVK